MTRTPKEIAREAWMERRAAEIADGFAAWARAEPARAAMLRERWRALCAAEPRDAAPAGRIGKRGA